MDERAEVGQLEIYRLLIEVKTKLEMSLEQRAEDNVRDNKDKADIFRRLGLLENRMAQVVILAMALSLVLSVGATLITGRMLHFGDRPETTPSLPRQS